MVCGNGKVSGIWEVGGGGESQRVSGWMGDPVGDWGNCIEIPEAQFFLRVGSLR